MARMRADGIGMAKPARSEYAVARVVARSSRAHTPAVLALARRGRVVFRRVEGERLDTGEPGGYLEAIIRYARSVPELRRELERIISKDLA